MYPWWVICLQMTENRKRAFCCSVSCIGYMLCLLHLLASTGLVPIRVLLSRVEYVYYASELRTIALTTWIMCTTCQTSKLPATTKTRPKPKTENLETSQEETSQSICTRCRQVTTNTSSSYIFTSNRSSITCSNDSSCTCDWSTSDNTSRRNEFSTIDSPTGCI